MEFLQQHWAVVVANPWLFATWTTLVASAAWIVIHFLYQHRIELYKHRATDDATESQRLRTRISELEEAPASNTGVPSPAATETSTRFDFGSAVLHLGGEGGQAPGSGGGGGGAIGHNARAGRGGDGGRITDLDGQPLPASDLAHFMAGTSMERPPGAGGAGASAVGPGSVGGDGGNGGDAVLGAFAIDPDSRYEIQIGDGGQPGRLPGQYGSPGGDTLFKRISSDGEVTHVLHARGGSASLSGTLPADWAPISSRDIEHGFFQISTLFTANSVEMRDGLVFALGGGWSKYPVPALPSDAIWPIVCVATWKTLSDDRSRGLRLCLSNPDGTEVSGLDLELPATTVNEKSLTWAAGLGAHLDKEGDWRVTVTSGDFVLSEVTIAVSVVEGDL